MSLILRPSGNAFAYNMTPHMISKADVLEYLQAVKDPEIPVISVVDLGIISGIEVDEHGAVKVQMTPTFAGCPALEYMKQDISDELSKQGIEAVEVEVMRNNEWSSNMISARGRQILKEFGLSPPPEFEGMVTLEVLQNAICPKCSSNNTFLMSPFGPTACRAIHHCRNCQETFEQFKPL